MKRREEEQQGVRERDRERKRGKNFDVTFCLNIKDTKAVAEIMANRSHAPFEEAILFKFTRILPSGNIASSSDSLGNKNF